MISFRCPSCLRVNDLNAEERVDGPDGEVVLFIVDSDATCTRCGLTVKQMITDQEGKG